MAEHKGPVLIELDEGETIRPEAAPAVEDLPRPQAAMERAIKVASARPSRLARWIWGSLIALLGFVLSVSLWDFVNGLLAQSSILGSIAAVLTGALVVGVFALAIREIGALSRLSRIDKLRQQAETCLLDGTTSNAKTLSDRVAKLYQGRAEMSWALERYREQQRDIFDAEAHLALVEQELLLPLDAAALEEVASASRQVATVTAIVPLALADVAAALFANLRMIRRVAEIYGGRGGTLGNWRLARSVVAHLVATGAVAVGDDLIGSIAGGGIMSKLSRRFGEGVINGALTARVGVAAIEVCRPLPFVGTDRPRVTNLVKQALAGVFSGKSDKG